MEISRIACEGDECSCQSCQGLIPGLVPLEPVQQALPGFPAVVVRTGRFRAAGKQVLCDGEHYGDMRDEDAANCAAAALNGADEAADWALLLARAK